MELLGKLKSLIENFNFFNGNTINSNNDNRKLDLHIHLPESHEYTAKELQEAKEQLKPILDEAKEYLLSSNKATETLAVIDEYSSGDKDSDAKKFIRESIPERDKATWFSSLILREQFVQGNLDEVARLKTQIVSTQQDRGNNIANLCTAGYLESLIMPLHQYLVVEKGNEELFFELYKTIVIDFPFAVFASHNKTESALKTEILNKIGLVKKYGWKKVSVHGIGEENVKKIQKISLQVEEECGEVQSVDVNSHESKGKIITVSFEIK